MDTRFIEVRKNVAIYKYFDNDTSSFSEDINIDFIPDEVSVKLLNYDADAISTNSFGLYSDLVSDVLVVFLDFQTTITPNNLIWTLRKPVRGKYTFNILEKNSDGLVTNGIISSPATISLMLEFVKYSTSFPDKKIF